MKNINVRVEDWLKERVEEIAEAKNISVTELVTESLKYGLDPAVVALRLPESTAAILRQAAKDEGMEFDRFVEGVLRIYLQEPWSAWKSTPASVDVRRKLAQSRDVFEEGRRLVAEMVQHHNKNDEDSLRICATVPRALHFSRGIELRRFPSWRLLYRSILSTLEKCKVLKLQRVIIYDEERESTRDLGIEPGGIEKQLYDLLKDHPSAQFEMKKISVHELMQGWPTESDRSYLNDFNVYGKLGVIFTDETSYGLPLTAVLSRHPRDIEDWRSRFDELFGMAKKVDMPDAENIKKDKMPANED